jgi:hypothetical protein
LYGFEELNIGHAIVAHALFVGWDSAVREMKALMKERHRLQNDFGIGTDIVEVARIESSLSQFGDDFAKRILDEQEWASYQASNIKARF